MKIFALAGFLFIGGGEALALTPQKYCESLAATSCEVLNIEPGPAPPTGGYGWYLIKYCRNQVFSSVTLAAQNGNSTWNYWPTTNTAGKVRGLYAYDQQTNTNMNASVPIDNNLCTKTWTNGSPIIP